MGDRGNSSLFGLLYLKFKPCARALLHISHLHLLHLPTLIHLLHTVDSKLFKQLSARIIRFGQEQPPALHIQPGQHSGVAPGSRARMGALQHMAGSALAHLHPNQPLLGPMQKLQSQILNRKIRSAKRLLIGLTRLQRGPGIGLRGRGLPVSIGLSRRMHPPLKEYAAHHSCPRDSNDRWPSSWWESRRF
jgi:hypothetical protein